MPDDIVGLYIYLPRNVKIWFQVACVQRDISMSRQVHHLIRRWLLDEGNKESREQLQQAERSGC